MIRALAVSLVLALLAPFAHAQDFTGTLARIKSTGTFTIGHRDSSPPFSYMNEKSQPVGYAIDVCQRIAAAVQDKLGLTDLKIAYVPLTAENRLTKVADGSVDIECGNTTNTLSREETVDFSLTTFITGASLLTKAGSGVTTLGDLAGKSISVVADTTTETALNNKLTQALINATVVRVKDHAEGMALLEAGRTQAHAGDQLILIGLARNAKDPAKFALVPELFSYEPLALAVQRNDADFRLVVDRAIARLYRTGDIMNIYNKWFGDWNAKPSPLLLAMFALNGLPE